jgi:hypothetical protein
MKLTALEYDRDRRGKRRQARSTAKVSEGGQGICVIGRDEVHAQGCGERMRRSGRWHAPKGTKQQTRTHRTAGRSGRWHAPNGSEQQTHMRAEKRFGRQGAEPLWNILICGKRKRARVVAWTMSNTDTSQLVLRQLRGERDKWDLTRGGLE